MLPASAVSGIYLAPSGRALLLASAGSARDQVEDYAARKGIPLAEVERWLAPNLAYTAATGAGAVS